MNLPQDPLLADVDRRWVSECHPDLGHDPLPTSPCYDPAFYARELEHLWRRVWLHVGRVEEIPHPGDYFVKEFAPYHYSLLVLRGHDGQVRAFHNVCSHRCNKLAWEARGAAGRGLTCKFHGWTYDTTGALRHVPDRAMFPPGFAPAGHGLTPLPTDVWEGFVFVHLGTPERTLREQLGRCGQRLEGYPFHEFTEAYRYTTRIRCNWKVGMDAFSEAYHAPYLHRRTFEDSLSGAQNPDCHLLDVHLDTLCRHATVYANPDYRPSRVGALAYQLGGASVAKREVSFDHLPAGVNPSRSRHWAFDIDALFPNYNLYVSSENYLSHQFWPISPTESLWEGRLYFRPAHSAAERFAHEYARSLQLGAWLEDTGTMERTQEVLASGVRTHFVLQEQEVLIRHFYKVLADVLEGRA